MKIYNFYSNFKILWLSLISLGFFWTINTRIGTFTNNPLITQRWIGITLLILYLVSCLLFALGQSKNSNKNRSTLIVELIAVGLISMLFATIIDWQILFEYEIPGRKITIHTGFFCIPIFVINLLTFWDAFKTKKTNSVLLFLQIFLISLSTFAFIDLLSKDRSNIRVFNLDFVSVLVNINPFVWVLLSLSIISFLTTSRLNLKNNNLKRTYFGIILFVLVQFTMLLNVFGLKLIAFPNFEYVHKSILFVIFWNFVYKSMSESLSQDTKAIFISRSIGNAIYHLSIAVIAVLILIL